MNSEKIMALADALYQRGYYDRRQGRDYDPRGSEEWQSVVDALTQQPESKLHARIEELKNQLEEDSKEIAVKEHCIIQCEKRIAELEADLAEVKQPESEPVKWCGDRGHRNHYLKTGEQCTCRYKFVSKIPLYTSPQPTPQVPEGWSLRNDFGTYEMRSPDDQVFRVPAEVEITNDASPMQKFWSELFSAMLSAPSIPEKREPKGVQKSKLEFLKGRADYISNRDEWVIRVAFEGRRHCLLDRFGRVVWLENASDAGPLRPQPAAQPPCAACKKPVEDNACQLCERCGHDMLRATAALPEDAIEQMAEAGARDSLPRDGMFSSEQLDYMRGERLPAYRKLAKLMLDAAGIPIVAPPVPDKPKPSHYAVLNTQGEIQFSMAVDGSLPENQVVDMMHQHINEAIDGDVEGAGSWVVRAVTASSVSSMAGGE